MIRRECKRLAEVDFPIAAVSRHAARALLPQIPNGDPGADDAALRRALLRFVADFANWDLAAHSDYLRVSRALVKAAHGEEAPLVVDPFAGRGSIPMGALRLGCEAFASDLNPVACLFLKAIQSVGPMVTVELHVPAAP